jgi:hypothetical protein
MARPKGIYEAVDGKSVMISQYYRKDLDDN